MTTAIAPTQYLDTPLSSQTSYSSAMQNHSMMGQAITTMSDIMALFTELANARFGQMSSKTEISRDAQGKANQVEAVLAKLVKPDSQAPLAPDVIAYMRANNILVNAKAIDDFIAANGPDLDKGDLMAVKAALESVSNRASDFVQQNQLKLQQIMQNFNTAVSMANSVQSMNAESTKAIAQAIR